MSQPNCGNKCEKIIVRKINPLEQPLMSFYGNEVISNANNTRAKGMFDEEYMKEVEEFPGVKNRLKEFFDPKLDFNDKETRNFYPPVSDKRFYCHQVMKLKYDLQSLIRQRMQYRMKREVTKRCGLFLKPDRNTFFLFVEMLKLGKVKPVVSSKTKYLYNGINHCKATVYTVFFGGSNAAMPPLCTDLWWCTGDRDRSGSAVRLLCSELKLEYVWELERMDVMFKYKVWNWGSFHWLVV